MSSGVGMLVLAIIAAISVVVMLHTFMSDQSDPELQEQRSRLRIRMELNDLEIHRHSHIVKTGDAVYEQHNQKEK